MAFGGDASPNPAPTRAIYPRDLVRLSGFLSAPTPSRADSFLFTAELAFLVRSLFSFRAARRAGWIFSGFAAGVSSRFGSELWAVLFVARLIAVAAQARVALGGATTAPRSARGRYVIDTHVGFNLPRCWLSMQFPRPWKPQLDFPQRAASHFAVILLTNVSRPFSPRFRGQRRPRFGGRSAAVGGGNPSENQLRP